MDGMGLLGAIFKTITGSNSSNTGARQSGRTGGGSQATPFPPKQKFYCKWCGQDFSDPKSLLASGCPRNPNGRRHELYEGSEKAQYICKYCGMTYRTLRDLTCNHCQKHPAGHLGHNHEPAL